MKRNDSLILHWKSLFLILVSGIIIMTGCKDEDPMIYDFGPVSEDFMQTYVSSIHLFFSIDQLMKSLEDSLAIYPTGAYSWKGGEVTIQPVVPTEYPKTFLVDFGESGRQNIINGKISGTISTSYLTEGSIVAYSFEDLIFHQDRPSGICTITNMGLSSGKALFVFQITDNIFIKGYPNDSAYSISFDGYQQVLWSESNHELTMPQGMFSGQSLTSDSLRFLAEVNGNYELIKEEDCEYIQDGIFDFTITLNRNSEEVGKGVIDFGYINPLDCDRYVIAIVDGEVSRSEFIYLMDWVIF